MAKKDGLSHIYKNISLYTEQKDIIKSVQIPLLRICGGNDDSNSDEELTELTNYGKYIRLNDTGLGEKQKCLVIGSSLDNLKEFPDFVVKTLPSFVSEHVRRFYADKIELPDGPVCEEKWGVVVMADVSGYSSLASNLALRGPIGVELLAITMNDFFDKV
jgi:hypothetical protein